MTSLSMEKMGGRPAPTKKASTPPLLQNPPIGTWVADRRKGFMYMTEVYVLDAETHYFLVGVVTDNSVLQIVKNNARCSMNKSS